MLSDTFRYALRSLTHRRLRSWLTIIGILIGIAAVVGLIGLGEGMRTAIATQFSSLGADRLLVEPRGGGFGPPGLGSAVKLDSDDLRAVQRAQHVDAAAGRLLKPVTVEQNRRSVTAFLASLPEEREERDVISGFLDPEPRSGRLLSADDAGRVTLGSSFGPGGTYADTFGEPVEVGRRIVISGASFEVVGILEKKGVPASDRAILMNEEDMRALLGLPEEYSFIVAQAASFEEVEAAREAIEKDLRRHRGVEERREDFTVQTSQDVLSTVDDVLAIVSGVLIGIAGISLLVGGIGIMNTMYTAVLQRKREIGVMKAVGASQRQILSIFLIESGLIGLVGGILGVLLGIGFSELVELGASQALGPNVLQASTPFWLVAGALAFSFVVGTLSGIFPARQAADLPPVEALR